MMSRIALYRQYRPQKFNDLIGQEHIRTILKNAVKDGRISHAYLFTGPRGTGKTSSARILARAINCLNPEDGEPCNTCEICTSALNESLTDIIEMDAASHTGVDEMRDLIEKAQFSPSSAKRKVYIIDEVHMLSKSAFNALLKTLEEPPTNTHFILATTEAHKVIATIVSRCQRFDFHRIGDADIVNALKQISETEKIKAEPEALELIAINAHGGMRDAISLFEQMAYNGKLTREMIVKNLGLAGMESVKLFVEAVKGKRIAEALNYVNDLLGEGIDLSQFVSEVMLYLREGMIHAVQTGDNVSAREGVRLIDIFFEASYQLKDAVISQLPLEMAVIRACKEADLITANPIEKSEPAVKVTKAETNVSPVPKKIDANNKDDAPAEKKEIVEKAGTEGELIELLRTTIEKPAIKGILRNAIIKQEKNLLSIRVGSNFIKERLESSDNLQILWSAVKKYSNVEKIEIEVAESQALDTKDVADIFGNNS
jgi:DNA polymerase-3 subunit gamma/tau